VNVLLSSPRINNYNNKKGLLLHKTYFNTVFKYYSYKYEVSLPDFEQTIDTFLHNFKNSSISSLMRIPNVFPNSCKYTNTLSNNIPDFVKKY